VSLFAQAQAFTFDFRNFPMPPNPEPDLRKRKVGSPRVSYQSGTEADQASIESGSNPFGDGFKK
jgi:hypothetical protein